MSKIEKYLNNNKINELSGKHVTKFKGVDEIGNFWVVTQPTGVSELVDIFFEADVFDMYLQIRGGLEGDSIVGIYKNKAKAKKVAEKLIKEQTT